MYTFKELDTGEDIELVSVSKLILKTANKIISLFSESLLSEKLLFRTAYLTD